MTNKEKILEILPMYRRDKRQQFLAFLPSSLRIMLICPECWRQLIRVIVDVYEIWSSADPVKIWGNRFQDDSSVAWSSVLNVYSVAYVLVRRYMRTAGYSAFFLVVTLASSPRGNDKFHAAFASCKVNGIHELRIHVALAASALAFKLVLLEILYFFPINLARVFDHFSAPFALSIRPSRKADPATVKTDMTIIEITVVPILPVTRQYRASIL